MDTARRIIRSIVGVDSRFYRFGSKALDSLATIRKEGLNTWRILREIQGGGRGDASPRSVALRNLRHPILIRPGTQDAGTVIDNVIREEYGQFAPADDPVWMIDAGAYIGDTASYFLSKHPNLKVIALEPNPSAHELAERNLTPYGDRAILMKRGLFSEALSLSFGGEGTGASIAITGCEIECTTIPALMHHYSIPRLDIVKMDIEGAEEAIFASKPEVWLERTKLLIIEIHGSSALTLISRVMRESNFEMRQYRSIWYCWPRNAIRPASR